MHVSEVQLERLRHLHLLGIYYRDQMEAMAVECRALLGCDAEDNSSAADWCDEIVMQSLPPEVVVSRFSERDVEMHRG